MKIKTVISTLKYVYWSPGMSLYSKTPSSHMPFPIVCLLEWLQFAITCYIFYEELEEKTLYRLRQR